MISSAPWVLTRLRWRLDRDFLPFQILIDLLTPVGYALLVANIDHAQPRGRIATAAFLVSGLLSTLRLPALGLMTDRLSAQDLLVAVGVSRRVYLIGHAISSLRSALIPFGSLGLCAVLLGWRGPSDPFYWLVLALYLVTLHGGALIMGGRFSSYATFNLSIGLLLLTASAICPLYYPQERVPELLRPLVSVLPPTIASDLAEALSAGAGLDRARLAGLAAMGVLAVLLGYGTFPWSGERPR